MNAGALRLVPAGIVLCGGRSTRFGSSKADFPIDGIPMLRRVVDAVGAVCDPVFVVAAAGQILPRLPTGVRILTDSEAEQGPLHGLAVGLTAAADVANICFAASCDLPYLQPDFIRAMFAQLSDHAAAVPEVGGRLHPLAAAYRTAVAATAWDQLRRDNRRLTDFLARLDMTTIPAERLPEIASLTNVNTPADLEARR